MSESNLKKERKGQEKQKKQSWLGVEEANQSTRAKQTQA
jgi:hypothetical protein